MATIALLLAVISALLIGPGALAEDCYRPEVPANAEIAPDNVVYAQNSTITYRCKAGYILEDGNTTRICNSRGIWSGAAPLCTLTAGICDGVTLDDGKCLTLVRRIGSWKNASQICGDNSSLLALTDESRVNASRYLLFNNYMDRAWVAGHTESVRAWRWTDNSDISEFSWAADEPTVLNNGEYNIQLRKTNGYRWRAISGTDLYDTANGWSVNKYVCQYGGDCPANTYVDPHISLNGSCFVFQSKFYHGDHDGKCVSWNEERPNHGDNNYWTTYCKTRGINWQDANSKCIASGGILAKADTAFISNSLTSYISRKASQERRYGGNYWLGASSSSQMEWRWAQNSTDIASTLAMPSVSSQAQRFGYILKTGSVETVTQQFGEDEWLLPAYLCESDLVEAPTLCGTPPHAPHTISVTLSVPKVPGDTIQQQCVDGYRSGASFPCYCLASGRWDSYCESSVQCTEIPTTVSRNLSTTAPTTQRSTTTRSTIAQLITNSTSQVNPLTNETTTIEPTTAVTPTQTETTPFTDTTTSFTDTTTSFSDTTTAVVNGSHPTTATATTVIEDSTTSVFAPTTTELSGSSAATNSTF